MALELRLVLTVEDFDAALRFYREGLGLPELADYSAEGGQGVLLDVGRATLEINNAAQSANIDKLEGTSQPAGKIRLAIQVEDTAATSETLTNAGQQPLSSMIKTPWHDLNQRFVDPDGLQVTLFQVVGE